MTRAVRPGPTTRALPSAAALALALAALLGLQAWWPLAALAATGPTAVDDVASTSLGTNASLAGATNDGPGASAIEPGLTTFPTDQLPTLTHGSKIDQEGRRLQVVDHGTFTINPGDGSVTFQPWSGLTGHVAVRYRITDADGATDDGLLSVDVTAGGTLDTIRTYLDLDVTADLLSNDVPGRSADGRPGTIDRTSARFVTPQPFGMGTVSRDGRTLTDPRVGVLTLDATGRVTFEPVSTSPTGYGASGVYTYTARDTTVGAGGTTEHHAYTATLHVDALRNAPLGTDDTASTPFGRSVTLPGLLNDSDTNPAWALVPELTRFWVDELPTGSYLSSDRRTYGVGGRGTFRINADGSVSFSPLAGFVGVAGAHLDIVDDHGDRGQEDLAVTVQPGPKAVPDLPTTAQNVTRTFAVLANDVPGKSADGKAGAWDLTRVRFSLEGQPSGATVTDYQRTLTVPGEGVYTADRTTGTITFDPGPRFVGTARPVSYVVPDVVRRTDGRVEQNLTGSTLTVTVTAVTPVAVDDRAVATRDHPIDVRVLRNDHAGAASAPLVPSSVRMALTSGLPTGSRLSEDRRTLVVTGRGTFGARSDGVVTFTPDPGFTGRVPTVGYVVSDTNGTTATGPLTVRVDDVGR